jgi:dihydrofolate synthase/folylpolyglutamate synthase
VSTASDAILDRLSQLHPKIIDLSLDRVESLLAALGHPEQRLPPVVHVAGTNGKGSVIAFLRAMMEAAGLSVHVYTSPHLRRFHERVRIAGELIGEDRLAAVLEECEAANLGRNITYFEITTAAAFLAFARTPADAVLLETGLGGRLDATNVIARPAATAITPVSLDHMQYLGGNLAEIAGEKAGILKPETPCVVGPQAPEALAVIEARAAELGAPLLVHGRDWTFRRQGGAGGTGGFRLEGPAGAGDYPLPALPGEHQIANAATALVAAQALPALPLSTESLRRGLREVSWPARLQRLSEGPLAARLPQSWELWLDGGHNAAAGVAIAEALRGWPGMPLKLIYGMLNTKAARDFLAPLAPLAQALVAVPVPGEPASLTAEAAAAHAREAGIPASAADSVTEALERHISSGPEPARVLICGSLYLAGSVLREGA